MKFILPVIAFVVLAIPLTTSAAFPLLDPDFAIVPEACRECPCGLAGVLQLAQNLMNAAISFGIIVMTLVIAYAGALFLFSPTNPELRGQGKKLMTNAVIGFVIVLAAWLIVDFVMKSLYNGETEFGPWNEILSYGSAEMCIQGIVIGPLYDVPKPGPVVVKPTDCSNCSSISERGLTCKTSSSCTAQPYVVDRLASLKSNFSGTWTVTEAFPPTVNHSNGCHSNGSCVDVGFRGSTTYTEANVKAFMQAATRAGFSPVYEGENCTLKSALVKAGYRAYCKSDRGYGHITGTHFSLYTGQ